MQVTIVGPLDDATGYAEIAREIALAFHRLGAQVRTHPVAWGVPRPDLLPEVGYLLNSFRAGRHATGPVLSIGIPPLFTREPGRPSVGLTMLECDRVPPRWVDACLDMDETWVPSSFNARTFVESGMPPEKVKVFPLGVDTSRFHPGVPSLPLPGRRAFVFLSVFEWTPRKGWDLLLRAFTRAFSARDNVCLAIKTHSNGPDYDASGRTIRDCIQTMLQGSKGERPPVLVLPGVIPQNQVPSLYAAADCFVLPSRGEGWNLPALEALACGVPVITTRWSGHLDYLDDDNAYLVEIEDLEPAAWPGHPADEVYRGARWARPSIEHLAHLMRWVYDHPEEARARAERGRRQVSTKLTWDRCAAAMLERLKELDARPRRTTRTSPLRTFWGKWSWTPPGARSEAAEGGASPTALSQRAPNPPKGGDGSPAVLLVVPSWGEICGVAEYTRSLAAALQAVGCRARVAGKEHVSTDGLASLVAPGEVVHLQYEYSLYELEALRAILARLQTMHVPLVLTLHSYTEEAVRHNAMLRDVRPLIVHSEPTRQKLTSSGWSPDGLHVIPMGVKRFSLPARSAAAERLGLGEGPHIGFAGLMHWHKGLLALATAAARLRSVYPRIRCHVFSPVGSGIPSASYLEHFLHECGARGLEGVVSLHLRLEPEEQLVAHLHAMDVNVLPYEDCGYWSTSAAVRLLMAARRPVITTDVPFFRDLGEEVLKISESSPEAIADAIAFVLSHPGLAALTVAAADRYVEENSWELCARRHVNLYRAVQGTGGDWA
ncbi:MAG: glycosyltransferase [Bacillota bacterium]